MGKSKVQQRVSRRYRRMQVTRRINDRLLRNHTPNEQYSIVQYNREHTSLDIIDERM